MKQSALTVVTASELGAEIDAICQSLEHGDLSEPLTECAQMADAAFGRNFAAMAGPHSGEWAPRKQNGSGKKVGDGHPLEIKSADMFQAETNEFAAGHIQDVSSREAVIGVDPEVIPYAAAQNYGHVYQNPFRVLPQRESMDEPDDVADAQTEVMADGFAGLIQ